MTHLTPPPVQQGGSITCQTGKRKLINQPTSRTETRDNNNKQRREKTKKTITEIYKESTTGHRQQKKART